MRVANQSGRLSLIAGDRALDVEAASHGRFAADPQQVFARWDEFTAWARTADFAGATPVVAPVS